MSGTRILESASSAETKNPLDQSSCADPSQPTSSPGLPSSSSLNKIEYLLACTNRAKALLDKQYGPRNWTLQAMHAALLKQGVINEDCDIIFFAIKNYKGVARKEALRKAVENFAEPGIITDKETIQLYLALKNKNITEVVKFLRKNNTISLNQADLLDSFKERFDLSDAKSRELIASVLTHTKYESQVDHPRVPKANAIKYNPARSQRDSRETQLLRQAATQLCFSLDIFLRKHNFVTKVETQIMHLEFAGKHHLFVAVNQSETRWIQKFFAANCAQNNLKKLLTTVHHVDDKEGIKRSQRFASKLLKRIFSGKINFPDSKIEKDFAQANAVGKILSSREKPQLLKISIKDENGLTDDTHESLKQLLIYGQEDRIHFLTLETTPIQSMHAEEFLVLIAKGAKIIAAAEKATIYTCVAGKRRPCMGCYGTMSNVIDNHGQDPGYFWMPTISHATPVATLAIIEALLKKSLTRTIDQDGVPLQGYNSGSDSEEDVSSLNSRSQYTKKTPTSGIQTKTFLSRNIFDEIRSHESEPESRTTSPVTGGSRSYSLREENISSTNVAESKMISPLQRFSLIQEADLGTNDTPTSIIKPHRDFCSIT